MSAAGPIASITVTPTPYYAHLHLPHDPGLLPEIQIYSRSPHPDDSDGPLTELPFFPAVDADPRAVAVAALAEARWAPAGDWVPVARRRGRPAKRASR